MRERPFAAYPWAVYVISYRRRSILKHCIEMMFYTFLWESKSGIKFNTFFLRKCFYNIHITTRLAFWTRKLFIESVKNSGSNRILDINFADNTRIKKKKRKSILEKCHQRYFLIEHPRYDLGAVLDALLTEWRRRREGYEVASKTMYCRRFLPNIYVYI